MPDTTDTTIKNNKLCLCTALSKHLKGEAYNHLILVSDSKLEL